MLCQFWILYDNICFMSWSFPLALCCICCMLYLLKNLPNGEIVVTSDLHHFNRQHVDQDVITICATLCLHEVKPRGNIWRNMFHKLWDIFPHLKANMSWVNLTPIEYLLTFLFNLNWLIYTLHGTNLFVEDLSNQIFQINLMKNNFLLLWICFSHT